MKEVTASTKRIVTDAAVIILMTALMLVFMILAGGRTRR